MKRFFVCALMATVMISCGGSKENSESDETSGKETAQEVGTSGEEGLITTSSGLQYQVLEEGDGQRPERGDIVTVHYTGTLKGSGEKFDSSFDRGEPIRFPVGTGRVIPGWDEGIMLLSKGAKAKLVIPSKLAYGPRERPGIPANSDLVFEVEVLDISKPEQHEVYETEGLDKQVTESGLEYYIVEEGTGPRAKPGDRVSVHYYGYLKEDGQRFDDSFSRGQPFQFMLGQGQVIPGWEEGLTLLKEGAKAKLVIPYQLAYGEQGNGPIPPKADIVFDVHLLKIN